jgi:hypothetical protein
MVIFLKSACLSIVRDRHETNRFMVRAPLHGDIERVFPGAVVLARPDTRFRYRAFVPYHEVARRLGETVAEIDYETFHPSVTDPTRRAAYEQVAQAIRQLQKNEPFHPPANGRLPVIRSDWKTEPMGSSREFVPLGQPVGDEQFERVRLGLLPEEMEDKWFMFYEAPFLYCHRSWTGFEAFRLRIDRNASGWWLYEIVVNMEAGKFNWASAHDAAMLAIETVGTNLFGLHPTGADAVKLWHQHGKALLGQGPSPGIPYKP